MSLLKTQWHTETFRNAKCQSRMIFFFKEKWCKFPKKAPVACVKFLRGLNDLLHCPLLQYCSIKCAYIENKDEVRAESDWSLTVLLDKTCWLLPSRKANASTASIALSGREIKVRHSDCDKHTKASVFQISISNLSTIYPNLSSARFFSSLSGRSPYCVWQSSQWTAPAGQKWA